MKETTHSAGCRRNGDGYGTAVFACGKDGCGWVTSFRYDEGGDGPYYHETRSWAAEKEAKQPKQPQYPTLSVTKRTQYKQMLNQADAATVERMMTLQGYAPGDIRQVLFEEGEAERRACVLS